MIPEENVKAVFDPSQTTPEEKKEKAGEGNEIWLARDEWSYLRARNW